MRRPTGFFVPDDLIQKQNKAGAGNGAGLTDFEIMILAQAKRAGLSFFELNELRMCDFVVFMDFFIDGGTGRPRPATQEDIDRFFAM